jgi:hypothetical protein
VYASRVRPEKPARNPARVRTSEDVSMGIAPRDATADHGAQRSAAAQNAPLPHGPTGDSPPRSSRSCVRGTCAEDRARGGRGGQRRAPKPSPDQHRCVRQPGRRSHPICLKSGRSPDRRRFRPPRKPRSGAYEAPAWRSPPGRSRENPASDSRRPRAAAAMFGRRSPSVVADGDHPARPRTLSA